jgi:Zn-dependent protease
MDDVVGFAAKLLIIAYSCILHECAHVWVAWKLGDPTGKSEGRLTLNPLPHIDPVWTLILPAVTLILAHFPIGGPKPAPVNPLNFKNPRLGYMWTALAGPASNILIAGAALALLWTIHAVAPDFVKAEPDEVTFNAFLLYNVMLFNLVLAAINLIPVPPLDGSRFLQYLLGPGSDALMARVERLGFLPIFVAFYFLAPFAVKPFFIALHVILVRLFGSEYALALLNAYRTL